MQVVTTLTLILIIFFSVLCESFADPQIVVGPAGIKGKIPEGASPQQIKQRRKRGFLFSEFGEAASLKFYAYGTTFKGGVRVALGDVNGDGVSELITAPGPGVAPNIRIVNVVNNSVLGSFNAFDSSFTGGVFVAAGDINGDGRAEIVAGNGTTSEVKVFTGVAGSLLQSFFAYDQSFTGGVHVAVGDLNGDGLAEVVTGPGAGHTPEVGIFGGTSGTEIRTFLVEDSGFTGGIFVAAGDVDGDGFAEIITGAGPGAGPHVRVFDEFGAVLSEFFAYNNSFSGGVRVAAGDVTGDGNADIITGPGNGMRAQIRHFPGLDSDGTPLDSFNVFDPKFRGGVFVAAD